MSVSYKTFELASLLSCLCVCVLKTVRTGLISILAMSLCPEDRSGWPHFYPVYVSLSWRLFGLASFLSCLCLCVLQTVRSGLIFILSMSLCPADRCDWPNFYPMSLCPADCSDWPSASLPSSTSCCPVPLTSTTWWSLLSACFRVWSRCVLCVCQCVRWWAFCVFVSALVDGLGVGLSVRSLVGWLCVRQWLSGGLATCCLFVCLFVVGLLVGWLCIFQCVPRGLRVCLSADFFFLFFFWGGD